MGKYLVELRDYPRDVAGWVLAPAAPAMAASTLLTTVFHRRALRPFWLLVGVLGGAGSLWWLSGIDNFTPKEQVAAGLACWGAGAGRACGGASAAGRGAAAGGKFTGAEKLWTGGA